MRSRNRLRASATWANVVDGDAMNRCPKCQGIRANAAVPNPCRCEEQLSVRPAAQPAPYSPRPVSDGPGRGPAAATSPWDSPAVPDTSRDNTAAPHDEQTAEALYGEGLDLVLQGDLTAAKEKMLEARRANPRNPDVRTILSGWSSARDVALRRLKSLPPAQLMNQAVAAEKEENYELAVALLEVGAGRAQRPAPLLNKAGVLLAKKLNRPADGLELLFRAVELESDNAAYATNLSKVMAMAPSHSAGGSSFGAKARGFVRGLLGKTKR